MERFTGYQIAEDGSSFAVLIHSPANCNQDILQRLATIEDILFDAEGKEVVSIGKLRELVQTGLPKEVSVETGDDREYIDYICPKCKDIIEQRRKGAIELYQPKYHDSCGQKLYWPQKIS